MGKRVESIIQLRKICRNYSKKISEPFYLRLLRAVSIYVTKLLLYTPITPNQITASNFFLGIFASLFFINGNYYYALVGAILLQLFLLLDCVDGEIARYRKNFSNRGYYLDIISSDLVLSLVFVALTFSIYYHYADYRIFIFGFLFIISYLMQVNVYNIRMDFIGKKCVGSSKSNCPGLMHKFVFSPSQKIGRVFSFLFDPTTIIPLILILAILDKLFLIILFYGTTYPLILILTILYQYFIGLDQFINSKKK